MALHDDFAMYYSNSYVGYRKDGDIVPFYITTVDTDRDLFDPQDEDETDWFGDAALSALVFVGHIGGEIANIRHDDPNLVLEMPDCKYIKFRDRYYWVTWKANRSTKKGMTQRRLSGLPTFNEEVVESLFSEQAPEGVVSNCFLIKDNKVHYKGVIIGLRDGDAIKLVKEAQHLSRVLGKEVLCQVIVDQ